MEERCSLNLQNPQTGRTFALPVTPAMVNNKYFGWETTSKLLPMTKKIPNCGLLISDMCDRTTWVPKINTILHIKKNLNHEIWGNRIWLYRRILWTENVSIKKVSREIETKGIHIIKIRKRFEISRTYNKKRRLRELNTNRIYLRQERQRNIE